HGAFVHYCPCLSLADFTRILDICWYTPITALHQGKHGGKPPGRYWTWHAGSTTRRSTAATLGVDSRSGASPITAPSSAGSILVPAVSAMGKQAHGLRATMSASSNMRLSASARPTTPPTRTA